MVADVTIGSFDWSKNGVLSGLKELQENAAFADLSFTCSDGLVLDAHQAVIERHSTLLKEFSRGTQCCLCRGKDCDFRLRQVSVIVPDVTSDTMETLLQLLYIGEATVDGEEAAVELQDACRMLGIALPSEITKTLREVAPKEHSETSSAPAPKIRLKSMVELIDPAASSEVAMQNSPLECPHCRKSFPYQFALNKHREKGCGAVEVTIEVNPFPGSPVTLLPRYSAPANDPVEVVDGVDDEPMILDELPMNLPAPPTPSTAAAILRVANVHTINPNIGVQLPNQLNGFNFWQQQAETVNGQTAVKINVENYVKKKKEKKKSPVRKTSTSNQQTAYGSSEGLPDDECPICHKFYPNNKKREHFASTHFQSELKLFVTTINGVATCNLCGKMGTAQQQIARHVGLAHDKLKDVVGPDHSYYIKRLGWNNRRNETVTTTLTIQT